MFWQHESEIENEECVIKVFALHLILKKWGIMGKKPFANGEFTYLATLKKVVLFWLINLVELQTIIHYRLLAASTFVGFKNVWELRLSLETQLKIEF